MARFYGSVGYAEANIETAPSVFQDDVVERSYFGDVIRDNRKQTVGDTVNPDISLQNSISIVADAYAYEHFYQIRYVMWNGVAWIVTDVEVQRPRLILRVGGVYNGETARTGSAAEDNSGD